MSKNKEVFSKLDLNAALNCPMGRNNASDDQITIRDYFGILLLTLWNEGDGFSGKRPFGESCWEYEVYKALVTNGFVEGVVDEYGCLGKFDRDTANKIVPAMVRNIFDFK